MSIALAGNRSWLYTDPRWDHKTGGEGAFYWASILVGPYTYPATGTTLALNGKLVESPNIGPTPSIKDGLEYACSSILTPLNKTEHKLEVTFDNYDDWRPGANREGSAGELLKFTVRFVNADGAPCKAQLGKWIWNLEGTSREPGIALNWPIDAKGQEYDLKLDPGETAQHDDTFHWAERPNPTPSALTDTMEVKPYDWGGWPTLTVKAILIDHRTIECEFKAATVSAPLPTVSRILGSPSSVLPVYPSPASAHCPCPCPPGSSPPKITFESPAAYSRLSFSWRVIRRKWSGPYIASSTGSIS